MRNPNDDLANAARIGCNAGLPLQSIAQWASPMDARATTRRRAAHRLKAEGGDVVEVAR